MAHHNHSLKIRRYLLGLMCAGSILSPACAQAQTDSIEQAGSRSLFVRPGVPYTDGYFPMGFVHGTIDRSAAIGFNLQQGYSSSSAGFINGGSLGTPSVFEGPDSIRYGVRNMSMARPAEALGGQLKSASNGNRLPLQTKAYGPLPTAIGADGQPRTKGSPFSAVNIFDEATRRYLLDYVRQHVTARVASDVNNTIAFWGLDNEWEGQADFSPQARAAFAVWLDKAYGGKIGAMNEAWQSKFASFKEAAESKMPGEEDYKANPALFLDWMNFQSEAFVSILADMARVMNETDPLHRGVIHKSTQQTIEMPVINRRKTFDPALYADKARAFGGGFVGMDIYGAGDREAYEVNYLYNCIRDTNRQGNYGVFLGEANNHSGPGHQFAATYWRMLSNGLKGVNYFTLGHVGATADWAHFGFTDPATGAPRDKLYYAARWASMVHRNEKFWTQSKPAESLPRVAILMPRRDVLLSDKDPKGSLWSYPLNQRWLVFRWLREQGYWVDVIPYSKLDADYLKSYQGLFLVGTDHLTAEEIRTVGEYVSGGGKLFADTRAGYWDEHHRVTNGLESVLGVKVNDSDQGELKLAGLTAQNGLKVMPLTAKPLVTEGGVSAAFRNSSGKGTVVYFPFQLGSLASAKGEYLDTQQPDGPTADTGEIAASAQEFLPGQWLRKALDGAGLTPGYRLIDAQPRVGGTIRVEQPVVDTDGNCAVLVSSRAQSALEVLPPSVVEITLPAGVGTSALWAGADDDGLQPVKLEQVGERYRAYLPEIRTAGVLYLFKNSAPMLGIPKIAGAERGIDGQDVKVQNGQSVQVKVQLFNPSGQVLSAEKIRLRVEDGWRVEPAVLDTKVVGAGQVTEHEFTVTAPVDAGAMRPNWIYPIVVDWSGGGKSAVVSSRVEVAVDAQKIPHILSDNGGYPETFPYQTKTGATYQYVSANAPQVGKVPALTNGFGGNKTGWRTSGRTQTANFDSFKTNDAEIVFDLKSVRNVRRVTLVAGPGEQRPQQVEVLTSEDGQNYQSQSKTAWRGTNLEERTSLFSASARYVRLKISWPEVGGTLDEVEIWGR